LAQDYWLLLVIAFAGTINPSAGSVSVFVPLEHAALTRSDRCEADEDRSERLRVPPARSPQPFPSSQSPWG
jgi:hypothetical protein